MSYLNLITYFFICLIAYLFYKLIIKPFQLLQFYKNQGVTTRFIPIGGLPYLDMQSHKKYNDAYYYRRQYASESPKPRAIGSNFGAAPVVAFVDPNLIKEFLKSPENTVKSSLMFDIPKMILGKGLLFSEGNSWKRHRKYVSMAFHHELVKGMIPDIKKISLEGFARVQQKGLKNVQIMDLFQNITGEVVGRLFFGEKFFEDTLAGMPPATFLAKFIGDVFKAALHPAILILGAWFVKTGLTAEHRQLMKDIKEFRRFGKNIINKKMEEFQKGSNDEDQKKNMLELFFEQRSMNPEDAFTDDEILEEFMTFFTAGMDTTGHLVTAMTYFYLANPNSQVKINNEIEKYFSRPTIELEELNEMEYMTAFMKESLRILTPIPTLLNREARTDLQIGDIQIKKGTLLDAWFFENNFDPRYHEDPETFRPERWIEPDSLTNKSIRENPFLFTPFSIGSRNCIGQHLAMMEAKIIFSLFVKNYDFKFTNPNYKYGIRTRGIYELNEDLILDLIPK